MDPQNLQTASVYVNNLLLSRGLLRNGIPVEFAKPSKTEGGAHAGMAQILNLVHDLVLRRDRETDTLTTVSQNLQNLRSTAAQQSQVVSRLDTRNAELDRQLALSVASERAARTSLRNAENRNRVLREEMGRLKASVAQIRSQCTHDVRKRDMEIQRMKRHLEGRRGREGSSGQVGVVVVMPGLNKPNSGSVDASTASIGAGTESHSASLKEETTAFLTQLSQNLSAENKALTILAQRTLSTLRNLQGLPSEPSSPSVSQPSPDPHVLLTTVPTYESLASSTASVLDQLRSLLTNPSFVSLEEVEIREDEIIRLREGWDKMEVRWREAVAMMDGWRKRMMETGDTINMDDLRKGLEMGEEVAKLSPWKERDDDGQAGAENSVLSEISASDEVEEDRAISIPSPAPRLNASVGMGLFPAPNILQPASGNTQRSWSPRKVSPPRATAPESSDPVEPVDLLEAGDRSSSVESPDSTPSKTVTHDFTPVKKVMLRQREQHGSERALTVQEKLERAQKEAEDARRREERVKEREEKAKGAARKSSLPKAKARVGRRRSTLSPEELEELLGFS